jgi:hypothetical protein
MHEKADREMLRVDLVLRRLWVRRGGEPDGGAQDERVAE